MRGKGISAVSAVISNDIREIYRNGNYLPPIADALKEIGLENVRMSRIGGGFSTDVFDTGYNQVLKITNMDTAGENGIRPISRYVLQPVCTRNLHGLYEVAIYPKLRTAGVSPGHSEILGTMLAKEGYVFADSKVDNIGLSPMGVPYVIDPDAINPSKKEAGAPAHHSYSFLWPSSQWSVFSCIVKGSSRQLIPDNVGFWKLSESYGLTTKLNQHRR